MRVLDLSQTLDAAGFVGLAVTNVHTGYNCSVCFEFEAGGVWSPHEFGTTASEAILKCLAKWAPVPVPLCPPPVAAPLLPPPY